MDGWMRDWVSRKGVGVLTRVRREVLPEPRGPMRRMVGRWAALLER